jgi:hypothetical protein
MYLGLLLVACEGMADCTKGRTLLRSDNTGVVAVVNKGRVRNRETNMVLKHVYALLAKNCWQLAAQYVPTAKNIADPLSRVNIAAFLAAHPQAQPATSPSLPDSLHIKLLPWPQ